MTEQTVWQPKDDQENAILAAANHLLRFGHPPVGERLCRRVPAPQGSVPGEVADILRPLVNEVHWARYGSEDDEQRAALVRYWLDAQPQAAPQPQGVSVPYPIRSVLDAALIVYITECRQVDDPDGEALARQAQQWLDAQPSQPGQEVD